MTQGERRTQPVRPAGTRAGATAAAPAAIARVWTVALSLLLCCAALAAPASAGEPGAGFAAVDPSAANPAVTNSSITSPAVAAPRADSEYRIAAGDELALKFFYAPELNESVTVRPDGRIHLQLVGEIDAARHSPRELADALGRAYATHLRYPQVSVEVEKGFARQQVFVGGEVGRPGAQPLLPSLTLMRALIVAQGLKDSAAANRVVILRRDADGRARAIRVDVAAQARDGADDGNDPLLQPFDVVLAVPSRISRVNKWIDQYVRRNLPVNVGFSYDLNNNRQGD